MILIIKLWLDYGWSAIAITETGIADSNWKLKLKFFICQHQGKYSTTTNFLLFVGNRTEICLLIVIRPLVVIKSKNPNKENIFSMTSIVQMR